MYGSNYNYAAINLSDIFTLYSGPDAKDLFDKIMKLAQYRNGSLDPLGPTSNLVVPRHFPEHAAVRSRWYRETQREFSPSVQPSILPKDIGEQHRLACQKLAEIKKILEK